jgi:hypothetical protein
LAVKSRLLLEAKSVAQQQIVDAMLKDYDPTTMTGNTLHSDATSKFFKHYESRTSLMYLPFSNVRTWSLSRRMFNCSSSEILLLFICTCSFNVAISSSCLFTNEHFDQRLFIFKLQILF